MEIQSLDDEIQTAAVHPETDIVSRIWHHPRDPTKIKLRITGEVQIMEDINGAMDNQNTAGWGHSEAMQVHTFSLCANPMLIDRLNLDDEAHVRIVGLRNFYSCRVQSEDLVLPARRAHQCAVLRASGGLQGAGWLGIRCCWRISWASPEIYEADGLNTHRLGALLTCETGR